MKRLEAEKLKDHDPTAPAFFKLETVTLPFVDDEGEPITSCVVVEADGVTPGQGRDKRKLSRREDAVLNALYMAIENDGVPPTAAIKARFGGFGNPHRKVAHLDSWRERAYPVIDMDGDQAAKKVAFQRARKRLFELGFVQTMNDFWWPIRDDDQPGQGDGTTEHTGSNVPPEQAQRNNGTERNRTEQMFRHVPPETERNGTHSYRSVPSVPPRDMDRSHDPRSDGNVPIPDRPDGKNRTVSDSRGFDL